MTTQERIKELEQELAQLKEKLEKENRLWEPEEGEKSYYVWSDGTVSVSSIYELEERKDFYNFFPTKEQALKASGYMCRSNMIIKACLQVDPDFSPDWEDQWQIKHGVYYNHSLYKWGTDTHALEQAYPCYVSTIEKAQQVCDLLNREEV
jgi:hypothetical protein